MLERLRRGLITADFKASVRWEGGAVRRLFSAEPNYLQELRMSWRFLEWSKNELKCINRKDLDNQLTYLTPDKLPVNH